MKPLLTYYGGKQRLAPHILPWIDRIPHTVYVEPFAGGAAVLFAKRCPRPSKQDHYIEVLNDLDKYIITLYWVAQTRYDELLHLLEYTPYSQAELLRAKELLNAPDTDELWRAWAVVVASQQSFSRRTTGEGWSVGVSKSNALYFANHRERLPLIFARLRNVHLSCEDAVRCIERWDSPTTLFYCDPPYPGSYTAYREGGNYSLEDFQRLCDALDNAQGHWILSNYPQDIEPKTAEERVEVVASMSASQARVYDGKRPTRTEVLWIRGVRALQPSMFGGLE